jgi:hypothetical protein
MEPVTGQTGQRIFWTVLAVLSFCAGLYNAGKAGDYIHYHMPGPAAVMLGLMLLAIALFGVSMQKLYRS